ncbi:MAG TPA: helix-turn-helix transcriptional regulator [Moheibacter sp.]|nr:helix-turn-helix transcriptional regulator [Moheibacter sp.]
MKIGAQLKKAREEKKFSQQEIANLIEISQKTLSNIESDKSNPTIEQLSRLSEIYELDILELLSNQGITFNKHNQEEENNGIIQNYHLPEKLIEQYEKRIEEKDELIKLLKETIERFNS